ncbi:hypothetical protein [Streptomyces sp. NPDC048248]|uniref:hypothetical protein n=1 Tax=Streptomyces sp. NPDC048248 TaxID=3365523 RepID=UPI00371D28DB
MPDRAPHDPPRGPAGIPGAPGGCAPGPQPASPDGAAQRHEAATTERGSFCLALCNCGWSGPARRARSQARTDAERHLTAAEAADEPASLRHLE